MKTRHRWTRTIWLFENSPSVIKRGDGKSYAHYSSQNHRTKLRFSPPARWGLLDFIRAVVLLLLLVLLLLQFLQCALLDLNLGPSQLNVHRWASTWDLPSSVCTAGPQPGTFPAQCAPLDLNLGPSQLSVHRWASTWDLPSSVCTAGPQRPDRMPEDMPDRKL